MSLAVRVDAATGIEERLEHIVTERGQLYSWTARPPQATACVLVCSSVLGDFTSNYHRERLLGRALAGAGYGAVRFHYAGEGNSEGDREHMTFSTLCEDALAAFEHAQQLGFVEFAVLGTRVGALVAASVAATDPSIPLAMWEPATDSLAFIKEAQRARRISQVAQADKGPGIGWREELARNGFLDLVGHDVYPPLIESLEGIDLLDIIGSQPRSVFAARFRKRGAGSDALVDALRGRGCDVEGAEFDMSEAWWFHSELIASSGDLIGTTTDWLVKQRSSARSGGPL